MRKLNLKFLFIVAIFCSSAGQAAEITLTRPGNDSLKFEIQRAIDKGVAWLSKQQNAEGWWSTADHPALSGLALVALQGDPSGGQQKEALQKGYRYLVSCA